VSAERYGVRWPDGSVTGGITESHRLAAAYARNHAGTVYAERDGEPMLDAGTGPADLRREQVDAAAAAA
jgi:hypothetical protein